MNDKIFIKKFSDMMMNESSLYTMVDSFNDIFEKVELRQLDKIEVNKFFDPFKEKNFYYSSSRIFNRRQKIEYPIYRLIINKDMESSKKTLIEFKLFSDKDDYYYVHINILNGKPSYYVIDQSDNLLQFIFKFLENDLFDMYVDYNNKVTELKELEKEFFKKIENIKIF